MSITAFPSVDGWITPRTDEVELTDQNCKVFVDKKIDYIEKIYLYPTGLVLDVIDDQNSPLIVRDLTNLYYDQELTKPFAPIDITPFVVEQDTYRTLPTYTGTTPPTEGYKNNSWYYISKGNEIVLPNSRDKVWQTYTYANILSLAIAKANQENGNTGYLYLGGGVTPTRVRITAYQQGYNILTAQFRVYYEPLGENVRLNTLKQEPVKNEFAIPFSQQQQIVNNLSLGKNMQATTNRTGVEQRTICRKVKELDKIRQVGSFWKDAQGNKWRLVAQDIEYNCGYALCTETWSKNWSMQSEFVGINREFRSWNIPADTVNRNILIEDYCYLTTSNNFTGASSHMTTAGQNIFMSLFDDTPNAESTEAGICKLSHSSVLGLLNASTFGFGNSIVFSATAKDNLSIGVQRAESEDDGGETKRYCKDVYYTNSNGEILAMDIKFGTGIDNLNTDLYPQSIGTENDLRQPVVSIESLVVEKDPSEKLSFTYQMHFVCYDTDIIVGAGLGANCPLVKNKESENLKYWVLNKPLPQGAQTITSEFGREVPRNQVVGGVGSNYVQLYYKRCITDANNNIIVANNNFDFTAKAIYFNFTSDYNAIQQHYESNNGSKYRDAIAE